MRGLTAPLAAQVGGGRYKPRVLVPPGKSAAVLQGGLAVEHFDYAPALAEYIAGCATFPPRLCACFLPLRTARLGQRVTAVRCWAGPWMRRARQPGAERRCMRAVPVQGGLWTLRIGLFVSSQKMVLAMGRSDGLLRRPVHGQAPIHP